MIDPIVRPARADDAAELAELEALARAGLLEARGGARWLDEHPLIGAGWTSAIADRVVFVAVLETRVPSASATSVDVALPVGYLVLDQRGALAHVDQVYVRPEARELGFGDALLAQALDTARGSGATLLEAHTLPGDRDIKNLYERAAITARLITVSKRL